MVVMAVVAGEAAAEAGVAVGVVAGGVVVGGVVMMGARAADVATGVGATGGDTTGVVDVEVAAGEAGGCPSPACSAGCSVRRGGGAEGADRAPAKQKR